MGRHAAPLRLREHRESSRTHAALPYAWQVAAGMYAAYAQLTDAPPAIEPSLAPAELAARAVENGDAHAIKSTETLLREHELSADPIHLAAAQDVVTRL